MGDDYADDRGINVKALVCGYGGFIGTAVAKLLPEGDLHKHENGDLTAPDGWEHALRCEPDTVFMCAGITGGSGTDPMAFVHDNLVMHAQMFKSCAEHGVKKIVAFSSTTGYPATGFKVIENQFFDGDPHPAYFNPAHTRRFIERLSAMYADRIETVWLRVSNAYGPGDNYDPQTSHVIAASVRKVAERQDPIIVWGDGSNVRDAVYIDDVARAAVMAADWPAGSYNIAAGDSMSVTDIVDYLSDDYKPLVEFDLTKPSMLPTRLLDTHKANALGWHPTINMRDGLARTLSWYRSFK